ncbi:MAG TPA: SRPBCC family protein [Patescibacteria group bacterium]|nr:SRPBCC family protein [Patescibacteria group bacterium]
MKIQYLLVLFSIATIVTSCQSNVTKTQPDIPEMNTPINTEAPIVSRNHITIDRPVSRVWDILTSINNWPKWQSEVTESTLNGPLQEGTTFDWKAGGLSFRSAIHTCKEKQFFGWTGETFGASAIHNWKFEEKDGHTIVYVEESLQGFFPWLLTSKFQKNLNAGMIKNLKELKKACEAEI